MPANSKNVSLLTRNLNSGNNRTAIALMNRMEPSAVRKLSGRSATRAFRATGLKPSRIPIAMMLLSFIGRVAAGGAVPQQLATTIGNDIVLTTAAEVATRHQFGNAQSTLNIRNSLADAITVGQPTIGAAVAEWNSATAINPLALFTTRGNSDQVINAQTNWQVAVISSSRAGYARLAKGCEIAKAEFDASVNARTALRNASLKVFKAPNKGRFESANAYNKRVNVARKAHNSEVNASRRQLKNAKDLYKQECDEEIKAIGRAIAATSKSLAEGSQALQVAQGTVNARIESEKKLTEAEANFKARVRAAEASTATERERAKKAENSAAAAINEARASKIEAAAAINAARKLTTMSAAEKRAAANAASAAERTAASNKKIADAASRAAANARGRAARAGLTEAQAKASANRAAENAAASAKRWNLLAGAPGKALAAVTSAGVHIMYMVTVAFIASIIMAKKSMDLTVELGKWGAKATAYTLIMFVAAVAGYGYGGLPGAGIGALMPVGVSIGFRRLIIKNKNRNFATSPNRPAQPKTAARQILNTGASGNGATANRPHQATPPRAAIQVNNYATLYAAAQPQRQTMRANVAARRRAAFSAPRP